MKSLEQKVKQRLLEGSQIVGVILKEARESKNFSNLEVAQKNNLNPEQLYKWENGLELAPLSSIRKLLAFYNTPSEDAEAKIFNIFQTATNEFLEVKKLAKQNDIKEPL